MTGWVVAGLVLAALLTLDGSPGRRLRRPPRAEPPRARTSSGWRGWRAGPQSAADPVQSISELAALLRAGIPATRAYDQLARDAPSGAWGGVLAALRDASHQGVDVAAAGSEAASACRDDGQRGAAAGLAAALHVAARTGAPTALVLDRLAAGLRLDEDARGAVAAAMAGPRATARLLAWLPLGGLVLGQLIGADPVAVLVGTGPGRASGVVGAVLAFAGWFWTRRLLRAAETA